MKSFQTNLQDSWPQFSLKHKVTLTLQVMLFISFLLCVISLANAVISLANAVIFLANTIISLAWHT